MNTAKLTAQDLLSSKEFEKNVAAVAYSYGYTKQDEIYPDLQQAGAIAVIESLKLFDPEKSNENFWGYTYLRLKEYVKREVNLHRNVVHIPANHLNSGYHNYENITHTYSSLNYEDGHELPLASTDKDIELHIDLKAAISKLPEKERSVINLKLGITPTINLKTGYKDIADTLNINVLAVMKLYKQAIQSLRIILEEA